MTDTTHPEDYAYPVAPPVMTLRDYFAGQALVGLLSNGMGYRADMLASEPYRISDVMLEERNK
jgi:hypothetical protein